MLHSHRDDENSKAWQADVYEIMNQSSSQGYETKSKIWIPEVKATFVPNFIFTHFLCSHVKVYTVAYKNFVFIKWHYMTGKMKEGVENRLLPKEIESLLKS